VPRDFDPAMRTVDELCVEIVRKFDAVNTPPYKDALDDEHLRVSAQMRALNAELRVLLREHISSKNLDALSDTIGCAELSLDLTTSGSTRCLSLPCLLSRSPRGRDSSPQTWARPSTWTASPASSAASSSSARSPRRSGRCTSCESASGVARPAIASKYGTVCIVKPRRE